MTLIMNKQKKQIEEMADDVRSYYCGSEYDELEDDISFSEHLVNLGWIKPDENAVVLSKEEYERLLKEETLCERLGNDIDVKLKYIYELEDKVAQVRKETTEKIANDISNDILVVNTKEYGNIEVVPVERLQEIIQTIEATTNENCI